MAVALAALSLGSSILQAIDFGSTFVSMARKIRGVTHRNQESLDEIASLRVLNTNLSDLSGTFAHNQVPLIWQARAIELVRSLNELGLGDAARKRDALYSAFRLTWKRDDINGLRARVNDFRSQLTLSLLVSMRYYASQSLIQQSAILRGLREVRKSTQPGGSTISNTSDPFGTSVLNYVTWKLHRRQQDLAKLFLKTDIIRAVRDAPAGRSEVRSCIVGATIPEEAGKRSLNNDKWAAFKDWLESDVKSYWITRKAGAQESLP
ncbi:uncharacterized protein Z519_00186 [Cladophialophora bantiana CBS 173.52]|uniref:Fungal N-terminal domain-containing protein n=1 Tax=Cladophialophora bantiana (strain ATCC 10958 / CBS 173.52 / CDC B-1940 / NIH 8579) TaxID=1442370 RepID=A0A0D2I5L7_CLAB1|nr:uncharacterized protein Z519_00186 [Cladophialophora bantiana CBS 173.52]KIW98525.1 hypothetical protein Z519_00186 [Cladophialophora bantiana CBS 173.52]